MHFLPNGMELTVIPPFSVIPKVLQKLEQEKSHRGSGNPQMAHPGVVPNAMRMLISCLVLLQHSTNLLMLPSHLHQVHPLHQKLYLLVSHISGNSCKQAAFHKQLQTLSRVPGEMGPKSNIIPKLQNGKITELQRD